MIENKSISGVILEEVTTGNYCITKHRANDKPIELTVPMDCSGQLCGRTLAFRITITVSPTDMALA